MLCVRRHWQDLGYLILYITGRPDMQKQRVVSWLSQHNFPQGMVFFSDGLVHDPLRQKAIFLRNLVREVSPRSREGGTSARRPCRTLLPSALCPEPAAGRGARPSVSRGAARQREVGAVRRDPRGRQGSLRPRDSPTHFLLYLLPPKPELCLCLWSFIQWTPKRPLCSVRVLLRDTMWSSPPGAMTWGCPRSGSQAPAQRPLGAP